VLPTTLSMASSQHTGHALACQQFEIQSCWKQSKWPFLTMAWKDICVQLLWRHLSCLCHNMTIL
jgi:hypothetical protein